MNWLNNFDERQQKEIEFCRLYAQDFGHGTDGHNAKLLIARLTGLLDGVEILINDPHLEGKLIIDAIARLLKVL